MLEAEYGTDRLFWFDEHWADYDPLYLPEAGVRAAWYGLSEYPYVRVDGSRTHIGIDDCVGSYQSLRTLVEERLAETGGVSPVEITGRFLAYETEIHIEAAFRLDALTPLHDLHATMCVVEDSVLAWNEIFPRVARGIIYEPITLTLPGDVESVSVSIPTASDWNLSHIRALVFLQQTTDDKGIIQGALLRGGVSGADERRSESASLSMIASAAPNPFRSSTEIDLYLSPASADGEVRLEVLDPAGRRVRGPIVIAAHPGLNVWSWDGHDDRGGRVRSGVYFARLVTTQGGAVVRLVRIGP